MLLPYQQRWVTDPRTSGDEPPTKRLPARSKSRSPHERG
ncbi:hypothetical protein HAL1_12569 [Halomonas sp. HAL1]|nr:hypothetical protein HAL1_12569 [Halomonas sp. HAL1]